VDAEHRCGVHQGKWKGTIVNHHELHEKMVELRRQLQSTRAGMVQEREAALGLATTLTFAIEEIDHQWLLLHESMGELDDEQLTGTATCPPTGGPSIGAANDRSFPVGQAVQHRRT
jgi:hypothetical protein